MSPTGGRRPVVFLGVFALEQEQLALPDPIALDTSFVVEALLATQPLHPACSAMLTRSTKRRHRRNQRPARSRARRDRLRHRHEGTLARQVASTPNRRTITSPCRTPDGRHDLPLQRSSLIHRSPSRTARRHSHRRDRKKTPGTRFAEHPRSRRQADPVDAMPPTRSGAQVVKLSDHRMFGFHFIKSYSASALRSAACASVG